MTKVMLEFPLEDEALVIVDGQILLSLGNGITLKTGAPAWITTWHNPVLRLEFTTEGSPKRDEPVEPPV